MKAKIGIVFMLLGSVLIASALGLYLSNAQAQKIAADAVDAMMPQLVDAIHYRQNTPADVVEGSAEITGPVQMTMPEVEIDGHSYVGFVGIPDLGLELPVMADWSYPQLKTSPCRFTGDMYSDDLVVMAHNFERHFGGLRKLRVGDSVTFTDMDGITVEYKVAALDVLEPTAVEEMTSGEYDLTLFTCTYGGQSRVTVRCDRVVQ